MEWRVRADRRGGGRRLRKAERRRTSVPRGDGPAGVVAAAAAAAAGAVAGAGWGGAGAADAEPARRGHALRSAARRRPAAGRRCRRTARRREVLGRAVRHAARQRTALHADDDAQLLGRCPAGRPAGRRLPAEPAVGGQRGAEPRLLERPDAAVAAQQRGLPLSQHFLPHLGCVSPFQSPSIRISTQLYRNVMFYITTSGVFISFFFAITVRHQFVGSSSPRKINRIFRFFIILLIFLFYDDALTHIRMSCAFILFSNEGIPRRAWYFSFNFGHQRVIHIDLFISFKKRS